MTHSFTQAFSRLFSLDISCAVGTWLLVASSACYFMLKANYGWLSIVTAVGLFLLFISLWLLSTEVIAVTLSSVIQGSLVALQFVTVLALYFLVPYAYTAILITLWCTLLPRLLTMKVAVLSAPLWSSPLWLIYEFYWQHDYMLISAAMFFMFNIFALIMVNTANKERQAKEQAKQLNTELMVAQNLLRQATKQAEQVRIARNIHDLLGHHLTALTINLQVASRLSQGEARDKIDTCHSLAKLLLSDVREAVSEIRENTSLDVKTSLYALFNNLPDLKVELHYPPDLNIVDMPTADCIIKSVQESLTNSLKHGQADHFSISLQDANEGIVVEMQDNGKSNKRVKAGNGLRGMQERVSALGGQVNFENLHHGFFTRLTLPQVSA